VRLQPESGAYDPSAACMLLAMCFLQLEKRQALQTLKPQIHPAVPMSAEGPCPRCWLGSRVPQAFALELPQLPRAAQRIVIFVVEMLYSIHVAMVS
jgi:hypothetical protein